MAEAAQQVARGREITLIDGTTERIIFTLYTLAVIEDELGSLDAIDEAFANGTKGKLVRTLGKMLAASIVGKEYTEDAILKLVALEDIGKVMTAVQEGLAEGFQQPQPTTAPTGETSQSTSPGADSSTSGAQSSDNLVVSSGA